MKKALPFALVVAMIGAPATAKWFQRTIHVDCDRGQSVQRALWRAWPGDTIAVTGTCAEAIVIRKDRIVLRGRDGAAFDGAAIQPDDSTPPDRGLIRIAGANGVDLTDLAVRNSPYIGVLADDGAAVRMQNVAVEDSAFAGIMMVNGVAASLHDVSVDRAGTIGIASFDGSSLVLTGAVRADDNGANGISIANGSTLEVRGADVQALRNAGEGLTIENSVASVIGFAQSETTAMRFNNNALGVFIANGSLTLVGGPFAGTGTFLVDVSNNGVGILAAAQGYVLSPFAAARFIAENNGIGMLFEVGSGARVEGGLAVRNNAQFGVLADGAGVIDFRDNATNPSEITGNGLADIRASFGTRLKIEDVIVDSLLCDPTVVLSESSTVACL